MHRMMFAADEPYPYIRDLPALRPLPQRLGNSLSHLRLVPRIYFIVGDDALKDDAGTDRQRLYLKIHHRPAGLGHGVFNIAVRAFARALLIDHHRFADRRLKAKAVFEQRLKYLYLDQPRNAHEHLTGFPLPDHVEQRVLGRQLGKRGRQRGILLLVGERYPDPQCRRRDLRKWGHVRGVADNVAADGSRHAVDRAHLSGAETASVPFL
ncbi:hypothetical protein SDC9_117629 [bioreactor metagenome]|uniref:Uncharacterized protein n=1 Tax=bioreactor metagenome TaxID=1076179 RepID=A0A645C5R0_9ZZZZ